MSSNAISGAVVFAKSLAKVARFYETVLGASVVHSEQSHIVLAAGPTQLVVHVIPQHIAQHLVVQDPPALREDTPIKLFFLVGNLAAAREKATQLGGGLAPSEKEWLAPGFRACDGWDPEGNIVQFRESVV